MLFSDLIDYLKNEKTFNIILNCSTDLHEIRDVELLDGTQTGYATDIVYFGYPDVLSPDMHPSQCILVRGENYLFYIYAVVFLTMKMLFLSHNNQETQVKEGVHVSGNI